MWAPLFAALKQAPDTVELPGHGRASDWDPAQDFQTQAYEMALEKMSEADHVVGHSFGATVALRLAVERPDLVRSLVLIEPVFFKAAAMHDPKQAEKYQMEADPIERAMAAGDTLRAAELFTDVWGVMPFKAHRPEQQQMIADRMKLVAASAPSIFDDNAGTWPRLAALNIPVLLLEGGESPSIISCIQQGLFHALPNANRVVIEKVGHMAPLTHPELIAPEILTFQERN